VDPCHSPGKCLRALQTRASRKTRIVGKLYNLYRVKTDILAVLTVKSGLDTHVTPGLEKVTECIPYVRQDQVSHIQ
jgi:hypothetical protein